jgi:hypothetical protein
VSDGATAQKRARPPPVGSRTSRAWLPWAPAWWTRAAAVSTCVMTAAIFSEMLEYLRSVASLSLSLSD